MTKQVLSTPSAPQPMGPYSVAVEAGGFVFLSGQVGSGAPAEVGAQTRRVLDNIAAILGDIGMGLGDIIKASIFLANMDDLATVNEIYGEYMGAEPPTRTTIQAGALPGGFLVEIEVMAARPEPLRVEGAES